MRFNRALKKKRAHYNSIQHKFIILHYNALTHEALVGLSSTSHHVKILKIGFIPGQPQTIKSLYRAVFVCYPNDGLAMDNILNKYKKILIKSPGDLFHIFLNFLEFYCNCPKLLFVPLLSCFLCIYHVCVVSRIYTELYLYGISEYLGLVLDFMFSSVFCPQFSFLCPSLFFVIFLKDCLYRFLVPMGSCSIVHACVVSVLLLFFC